MNLLTHVRSYISAIMSDLWLWFTRLNQQEWFVLLAVVAALGFLCMKGLSQKSHG